MCKGHSSISLAPHSLETTSVDAHLLQSILGSGEAKINKTQQGPLGCPPPNPHLAGVGMKDCRKAAQGS